MDSIKLKSVVARYLTGSGVKAEFIVTQIREINRVLYIYGLIVTKIYGDGTTENRSNFKQLATMTVKCVFLSHYSICSATSRESIILSLLDSIPNEKLGLAFSHPYDDIYKIFIGGEMPKLIKNIVNRLERSDSPKNKVCLSFQN